MIRTLSIAAIAAVGLAGAAQAGRLHTPTAADRAFIATYDRQPEHTAPQAPPAPTQRSDFGSFSAAATAHNLGY